MNTLKKSLIASFSSLLAGAAFAQGAVLESTVDYARVLSVAPIVGAQTTRDVCHTDRAEPAQRQERSNTGAVLGGLGGALVGSRFGDGNGRAAATVAGAIGGAIVGDRIDNREQERNEPMIRRCETIVEPARVTGYQVNYDYQGRRGSVILNYDPGQSLRIRRTLSIE